MLSLHVCISYALDRVTLPMSDPFWEEYYPPNRWNCKCDLRSTDEPVTTVPDETGTSGTSGTSVNNPQPGLDNNPGIDAKLFADSHPYIAHAHKGAQEAVENAVEQLETRLQEYERLKKDPDYKNVEFNAGNGGLKAVHFGHNFDKVGGEYEKKVMEIGFKTGNCVILADERGNDTKHIEGTWNGLSMEVSGKNGKSSNNLKKGLIHCAEKPGCKVAIIYIYEDVFDIKLIDKAIDRYIGLRNCEGPWVAFDEVICMHKGIIVYQKSHPMQK